VKLTLFMHQTKYRKCEARNLTSWISRQESGYPGLINTLDKKDMPQANHKKQSY
jgi:hypothetical protein